MILVILLASLVEFDAHVIWLLMPAIRSPKGHLEIYQMHSETHLWDVGT
jgi:hypothetical protein